LARAAVVALLALLVLAPLARADGDPASDYLLTQPAFLPPDVVIPKSDADELTATLAAAKKKGYEIRVAVIGTRYDMGSVGALFRKPQQYARFLGQELRFVYKGKLLVVMPNGYGASKSGKPWPAGEKVVAPLPPTGKDGGALARGATSAVRKLAAASGVQVEAAPSSGSSSSNVATIGGVIAIVVVLAVVAAFFVRGRAPARLDD
jgi:hypothetical protein